jgi:hypothetical protein
VNTVTAQPSSMESLNNHGKLMDLKRKVDAHKLVQQVYPDKVKPVRDVREKIFFKIYNYFKFIYV